MERVQRVVDQIHGALQDDHTQEKILQSVLPLWGKDPQFDGALVDALVDVPDTKVANVLQRLLQVTEDRRTRKAIKRSLYRLKGKGIVPDEGITQREEGAVFHLPTKEPAKCLGSGIDALGNQLVILALPRAGRGVIVIQGLLSDTNGMIDFSGEEMTRKGFKEFTDEVQKKMPFPMVEIEPSYGGFLFIQAYQRTVGKNEKPPQDYSRFRAEIEGVSHVYERPLIYSHLSPDEVAGDDRLMEKGGDLLKLDLFAGWGIKEEKIRPYADAVIEAQESKLILNESQKEVRVQEVYLRALTDLFTEERKALYQRRLEEMSYVLLKQGKREEAKIALAVAMDLKKPLNPFRPNPFLHQLVIKSVLLLLAEVREKRAKEPSLIVTP
jgi:hypothetical protein